MTTQAYLNQAIRFERMTRNKLNDIERYRTMATSTTVQNNADRVQSSGSKDKLGTIVSKIVDLENEIISMTNKRDTIIKQIESIDDTDMYQVLYSKYIDGQTLHEIRMIVHCSKSQVYRLHDIAIQEFEKKYGKNYLD